MLGEWGEWRVIALSALSTQYCFLFVVGGVFFFYVLHQIFWKAKIMYLHWLHSGKRCARFAHPDVQVVYWNGIKRTHFPSVHSLALLGGQVAEAAACAGKPTLPSPQPPTPIPSPPPKKNKTKNFALCFVFGVLWPHFVGMLCDHGNHSCIWIVVLQDPVRNANEARWRQKKNSGGSFTLWHPLWASNGE